MMPAPGPSPPLVSRETRPLEVDHRCTGSKQTWEATFMQWPVAKDGPLHLMLINLQLPFTSRLTKREPGHHYSLQTLPSAPGYAEASSRRSRSAYPDRQSIAIESSDSDQKRSRHKHRSKSRRGRHDPNHAGSAAEEHRPERRSDRRDTYDGSRPSPLQLNEKDQSHRSAHGRITPPQTPSLPKESPYTSTAEESDRRRRRDKSRDPGRRYSKDSPYNSAAEDKYKRRDPDNRAEKVSSRRQSTIKANRLYLDLSQQPRYDPNAPNTSRTPRAQEDYFQKAFDDNRTRHMNHGSQYPAQPSPISSPPTSPPHTPRGDRRSRGYFELNAPTSPPKQRSRPPSAEMNPVKPLACNARCRNAWCFTS